MPIFYRQTSHSECGPVALQIILSCFGEYVDSHELTQEVECGGDGWSVREFCEVALSFGVHTIVRCSYNQKLLKENIPFVLLVNAHYVVVYKITSRKVYIADPNYGRVILGVEEFQSNYILGDIVIIECKPIHKRELNGKVIKWGLINSFKYIKLYFNSNNFDIKLLICIVLGVGMAQSTMPFISRIIIDEGLNSLSLSFIQLMTIASGILMLSSIIGTVCQSYISSFVTYRIKSIMLIEYFEKITRMVVEQVYRYNVGDIMQRLRDSERIQYYLANVFFTSISSAFFIIIYFLILLYFDVSLFSIAFVSSIIFVGVKALFLKERKSIDVNIWNVQSKCNRYILQCYEKLTDIKLFNLSPILSNKWGIVVADLQKQQLLFFRLSQFQEALTNFILQTKDILMTYFACSYVLDGDLTIGGLFAIQYLAGLLNGPLNKIVIFMDQTQMALISIQRVSLFNNQNDEVDVSKYGNGVFTPKHKYITLDQVSYKYPDGTIALKGFTMRFVIGQKVGIIGKSGCGKSTLLKILCGIIHPSSGDMFVGSTNVKSLNWNDLREKELGVMLQENSIIEGTVLSNIVCSNEYDETRLIKCVEIAHIRDEIEKMPMGYKTLIGDANKKLSSGQRQRLLIARALYQKSHVYIFDEIANGLSNYVEQRIVEKIDENRGDALRIYVTHRGESIKDADMILVIDEGRLVGLGKHEDLIVKSGYYKSLFADEKV